MRVAGAESVNCTDDADDQPSSEHEQRLAALVGQIVDRVQAGEALNFSEVCRQHPEFTAELKEVWGAIVVTDAVAGSLPPLFVGYGSQSPS